jgi:curli biogenesis system outer membrane secretion channel CsgG
MPLLERPPTRTRTRGGSVHIEVRIMSLHAFLRTLAFGLVLCALVASCASESHRTVETATVASHDTPYSGPKYALAIGKFNNASPYMRGIFAEGTDQLGNQAKTILKTHLSQSGRFMLVDRDNMEEIAKESEISGAESKLTGAQVVLTGEVTEFGRKVTGDQELFGILGKAKQQTAYSKVSINVVDVATSQVIYSVQGAGEYALSDREVIGFGSTSGYDSTLNGKVLNLSITDAVNKLVDALEKEQWHPVKKP